MPYFYIEANATPMGEYKAPSKMQALDAYAIDAGYNDYHDMLCQLNPESPVDHGGDEMCLEIDTKALIAAVEQKTGLACCQPSFDGAVIILNGDVWETWELFAEENGLLIQDILN